jgi:phosphonatase-like hydrolase
MQLQAVLFDFIGTVVMEKVPGTVVRCFEKTFQEHGIKVTSTFINENRGRNKREVIELAISQSMQREKLVDPILNTFERNIEESLTNFSAAPKALEVFMKLHQAEIKVGLGTGLTRDSFEKIMTYLKWNKENFDYTATSEEIGKGRPHPDMIFDMMRKLHIMDPKEVLKVGDTVSDIQEGKCAGVMTAAILSGTQSREVLEKEKPDFVFKRLDEIHQLL